MFFQTQVYGIKRAAHLSVKLNFSKKKNSFSYLSMQFDNLVKSGTDILKHNRFHRGTACFECDILVWFGPCHSLCRGEDLQIILHFKRAILKHQLK